MKTIGVREFRDRATHYLSGDETLAIQKHGVTIGHYVPVKKPNLASASAAAARLDALTAELAKKGITEDSLVEAILAVEPEKAECS